MQMARPMIRAIITAMIRRKERKFPKAVLVFSIAVTMMLDAPIVVSCEDPFVECSLIDAVKSAMMSIGLI